MNTNSPAPPGQDDDRQDAWEASFFSPDGTETSRSDKGQTKAPPPPNAPPPKAATKSAAAGPSRGPAAETVQEHVDDLGDALQEKFVNLLADKVREKDGHLTAEDVAEMGQEFRSQLQDIETIFLDAVESYTLAREKTRVDQSRGNLFHRLMVKKFEHRFTDEQTLQQQPERLSRRMLPGYMNMILVMFGAPRLANYEERTRALIDKMRRDSGGRLDWGDVFKSPEAKKITLLAEVDIARRFDDIDKRLEWMIAVVNSNLIPADEDLAGTPWTFNKSAAEWLMTSLLVDLRPTLSNEKTRKKIAERMGGDGMDILDGAANRFS